MENLLDLVRQVAGKYPATLTHEQCALIVNEVAWLASQRDPNWGISKKMGGKRARLPNGVEIGEDVLHYRAPSAGNPHGQIVDILSAAPEQNAPVWILQPYHGDPNGRPWLPPFDPATFATTPAPPPAPAPDAVLDAIRHLQDRLTALAHDMNVTALEVLALRNDYRRGMVIQINAKPFGTSTGTVKSPS